jgi:hypothetical protein
MFRQSANWDYKWGQIVGRAWADDDFNQRLRGNPAGVLEEYGMPQPTGLRIELLDNPDRVPDDTDGIMHLVLPGKPSAAELSEEELSSAGSGAEAARCGCGGCHGCGGCGGCGGCAACIWCWSTLPEEN